MFYKGLWPTSICILLCSEADPSWRGIDRLILAQALPPALEQELHGDPMVVLESTTELHFGVL